MLVALLAVLAACGGVEDAKPRRPEPEPTTSPAPTTPAPTTPPDVPHVPEVACDGIDANADGVAEHEDGCVRVLADVVLTAPAGPLCCNWWTTVGDLTGDGRADVVLNDLESESPFADAWLVSATESGDVAELAFARLEIPPRLYGTWSFSGEFDGEPGPDLWVAEYLFPAPLGDLEHTGAAASLVDGADIVGVSDLDGDGVDDLLLSGVEFSGGYHSGGYVVSASVGAAYGPFAGPVVSGEPVTTVGGAYVRHWLFDADGSGPTELAIDHGTSSSSGPIDIRDIEGKRLALLHFAGARPAGDVDGDGADDLLVQEDVGMGRTTVYAGPFSGTVEEEDARVLVSWPGYAASVADLDGDGRAELLSEDLPVTILRDATGVQREMVEADWRFRGPTVPDNLIARPFAWSADLGAGATPDLAVVTGSWMDRLDVYFDPLY